MHYREDAFRMAYALQAPNHRLTSELLQHLEIAADHVTRYPPICLNVYHMATQELHAIPDHDVYVNTREMTYCVELHETPFCLVGERDKDDLDQYAPCECHEVYCSRCRRPFMAMTEDCGEITSCNETDCEYCGHYRDQCAAEEITAELIHRATAWNQDPHREAAKTPYHRTLEYAKGSTLLTQADCYAIAITEVFDSVTPVLHPVVKNTLDRQAQSTLESEKGGGHVWTFADGSTLESEEQTIHTSAL